MDSEKEAVVAAIIIAAFADYIKRKKGGRERNGLNLGFKSKIPGMV